MYENYRTKIGGEDMELIKANDNDFNRLTRFYRDVILHTENMDIYARWEYGKHPTDEMILEYIRKGVMYYCEKEGSIISAAVVTPYQGEDYHNTDWALHLADDEVAVVHILCVDPRLQKHGVAREIMRIIIEMSRNMGRKAVRLDALACNSPAHRLYESIGFVRRGQQNWHTANVGRTDFFLYEFVL